MTIKNEVQGVVQALFGAFAGGYLPELTGEATNNGTSAMAARLVSIQGIITGQNMTSDKVFVDTILHNMGVPSTNAAYDAAAGWAMNELSNGGTRGDVVTAAVAFLTGIAAGTIVDSKYTAIAEAFVAKVEAGVEYSESEEGAAELVLADLRTEADYTAPVNLTDLLATLKAAQTAAAAALNAVAAEDASNDIDEGLELGEEATEEQTDKYFDDYVAADGDAELAEAEALVVEAVDAHEAAIAALAIARQTPEDGNAFKMGSDASIAAALKAANDAVAAEPVAKEALAAYNKAKADLAADVTKNGTVLALAEALSDAIGAYLARNPDLEDGELAAVTTAYIDLLDADPDDSDAEMTAWEDAVEALVLTINGTPGVEQDADAEIAAVEAVDPVPLASGARGDALTAVITKVVARFDLEDEVADTLAAFEATAEGAAQLAAQEAQDDRTALINAVADTAAAIPAAEAYAEMFGKLVKALTDADQAVEDAEDAFDGGDYVLSADGTTTDGNDIITVGDEDITVEGFAGGDLIVVSGYTFNSGDIATDGDNTKLEFFLKETEDGVNVIFETEIWGSNSAVEEITIELVGVELADLVVGTNYITLA